MIAIDLNEGATLKPRSTGFEESKTAGDAVCVYKGKEFDTRPFPSDGAPETPTRVGETEPTGTSVPTVVVDDVAEYIMEGIRQHITN